MQTHLTTASLHEQVQSLLEALCEDRDLYIEEELGPSTQLVGDLGLASVDFVQLFVEIEGALGRKIGFHELLMPAGRYVDDLSIAEIVAYILRTSEPSASLQQASAVTLSHPCPGPRAVDEATEATFIASIPQPRFRTTAHASVQKNPRAVFILSSPRSGSTLLRVMLAGHRALFSPPELHLLNYETLDERRIALDNHENRHLLTGTVTALAQARGCGDAEAQALLGRYERAKMSTIEFFGELQRPLNDRLLVDKTPIYPLYSQVLDRAEAHFEEPLYIHLVRHPGGMARSFMDAKMEQLIPFMRESSLSRRQLAELFWLVSQRNTVNFLAGIPRARTIQINFEDLVTTPEASISRLCEFLGLDFDPAMLDPYGHTHERMTAGLGRISQSSGDLKFHLHDRIEAKAAERWRDHLDETTLCGTTWAVAESLGYRSM